MSQRSGDGPVRAVSRRVACAVPAHRFWPVRGTSRCGERVLRSPRVTMGATMGWPAIAVLGFVLLIGVVVILGVSSTARYEFEHNGARERQRSTQQRQRTHP